MLNRCSDCWLGKSKSGWQGMEGGTGHIMLWKCEFRQFKCSFSFEVFPDPLGRICPSLLCALHEWLKERAKAWARTERANRGCRGSMLYLERMHAGEWRRQGVLAPAWWGGQSSGRGDHNERREIQSMWSRGARRRASHMQSEVSRGQGGLGEIVARQQRSQEWGESSLE